MRVNVRFFFALTANGSQVYLVADLKVQNFQISNNLNK